MVAKDSLAADMLLPELSNVNDSKPAIKGGLYEGAVVDEATVKKLASMPSRDEALSILVGTFNSVLMMFALALDAKKTQLEGSN